MSEISVVKLRRFTVFFIKRENPLHSRIYFLWHDDGRLTR